MPPRPGPRGAAAAGGPQARSAPFSVHARGVPLFDGSRFWDLPRHVARLLLDFRDISSSTGWWLACQTWLSFWSALIAMLSGQSVGPLSLRAGLASVSRQVAWAGAFLQTSGAAAQRGAGAPSWPALPAPLALPPPCLQCSWNPAPASPRTRATDAPSGSLSLPPPPRSHLLHLLRGKRAGHGPGLDAAQLRGRPPAHWLPLGGLPEEGALPRPHVRRWAARVERTKGLPPAGASFCSFVLSKRTGAVGSRGDAPRASPPHRCPALPACLPACLQRGC